TLVHELGHSLHSYFTRGAQPFVTGDYTIFVAEVASTLNEALLTAHLLRTTDNPDLQRHLLVQEIEGIRSTIFRQTLLAQFELDMHERVENRDPLTSDWLSDRYFDLTSRYYGPALVMDDAVRADWARVPHFYYDFYVYQYATGKSAALALARQIQTEGQPAVDRYLRFLHSGSSASPIQLLKDAGVDMTSPAPIEQAMSYFDELLTQLEALA
ncbi:MAG TPA: M3 family metallopeptidase, partial [Chloroflexota bacterium]|nr:M3 family metallopeptidase [Chloroflexota bacterium]